MSDIDTGDTVRHIPSDESWLVAFVEGGKLCACGWPCSLEPLSDFVLVRKAPLAERLQLLNDMASMKSSDPRRAYAQRALRAAARSGEAAPAQTGAVHGQSASTEHRDALMKLSRFAHTAAGMIEKDMRNNLADIADQLIALATPSAAIPAPGDFPARIMALLHAVAERNPPEGFGVYEDDKGEPMQDDADAAIAWVEARAQAAAVPAAPSEALVPSRMEVDSWRRSLLTWREASAAELIENTAGLKQCLSNAARLLLDHPALAHPATVFHPFDPAIQLLPEGTRIAVYRHIPGAVEHEDPKLRLPPREVNSELPTTVAQRFVHRNYERPPVAWMHFADRERCISAAVKKMGQRAGGQSAVWVGAYTIPLVGGD